MYTDKLYGWNAITIVRNNNVILLAIYVRIQTLLKLVYKMPIDYN